MLSYTDMKQILINFINKPSKVPENIANKFRIIDEIDLEKVRLSLMKNYFYDFQSSYFSTKNGLKTFHDHLIGRLENDRATVIPWLNDAMPLEGSTVLEIGCGTGSSSVALAEQGASVFGIDLVAKSLAVAKDRCNIYNLNVNFLRANATEVDDVFPTHRFDLIIFYASLEHMTYDERIIALKKTWDLLNYGGFLCIIEAPNRLWYYDSHTSLLPFFHWLPDELAFKYSIFSPREDFQNKFTEYNTESELRFIRTGRGVSFHEIELAIKPAKFLHVISYKELFWANKKFIRKIYNYFRKSYYYELFLAKLYPDISRGFFCSELNIIFKK